MVKNKLSYPKIISLFFISIILVYFILTIFKERETLLQYNWRIDYNNFFLFVILHALAMLTQFVPWHLAMKVVSRQSHLLVDFKIYFISLVSRRIPIPIWYI